MSAEQMSQFAMTNYQFYKKISEKSIFLELEQNKRLSYDFYKVHGNCNFGRFSSSRRQKFELTQKLL